MLHIDAASQGGEAMAGATANAPSGRTSSGVAPAPSLSRFFIDQTCTNGEIATSENQAGVKTAIIRERCVVESGRPRRVSRRMRAGRLLSVSAWTR